jgi:hypothetical protein
VGVEQTGAPGASGEESVPADTSAKTVADEPKTEPPPILLVSAAGKQIAAEGSSCVQYTDPTTGQGTGVCADVAGPSHPDSLSIVHPGEGLVILLADGYVTDEGSVSVQPLGCSENVIREFDLALGMSGTHTRVDLDPGAYQLDVFARFQTNDGRSGDVSGTIGLLVDPDRAQKVIPADARFDVCQFPA